MNVSKCTSIHAHLNQQQFLSAARGRIFIVALYRRPTGHPRLPANPAHSTTFQRLSATTNVGLVSRGHSHVGAGGCRRGIAEAEAINRASNGPVERHGPPTWRKDRRQRTIKSNWTLFHFVLPLTSLSVTMLLELPIHRDTQWSGKLLLRMALWPVSVAIVDHSAVTFPHFDGRLNTKRSLLHSRASDRTSTISSNWLIISCKQQHLKLSGQRQLIPSLYARSHITLFRFYPFRRSVPLLHSFIRSFSINFLI